MFGVSECSMISDVLSQKKNYATNSLSALTFAKIMTCTCWNQNGWWRGPSEICIGSTRRPGKRQRNLQGANMELSGSSALWHRQSAPDAPCTYVLSCDRRPWHTANDLLIPLLPAIALTEFRRNGAANYCVFYPCARDRRNNMATRCHFGFVWLWIKEAWPKFGSLSKLG